MERQTVETTLGDLVVALMEEAVSCTQDEKEAYQLVAHMLIDLLHNSAPICKSWH